jgi:hypothetical protein
MEVHNLWPENRRLLQSMGGAMVLGFRSLKEFTSRYLPVSGFITFAIIVHSLLLNRELVQKPHTAPYFLCSGASLGVSNSTLCHQSEKK